MFTLLESIGTRHPVVDIGDILHDMAAEESSLSLDDMKKQQADRANLYIMARVHQWLLRLTMLALLAFVLGNLLPWRYYDTALIATGWIAVIVCYMLTIFGVVVALMARRSGPVVVIVLGLLTSIPGLNLISLVGVCAYAAHDLSHAGMHVGLMGVGKKDMEWMRNSSLCRGCGYNLLGNVSGQCPECGREIAVNRV